MIATQTQRVVRMRQLVGTNEKPGLVPMSQSTVWRLVSLGKFPKPFKLSDSITVWSLEEIRAWVTKQREAA